MKLPTISDLVSEIVRTVKRFPLSILVALIGTAFGIDLVHGEGNFEAGIVMTVVFALPFVLAVEIFLEARKYKVGTKMIGKSLALLIAMWSWYGFFQYNEDWHEAQYSLFLLMESLSFLLLAFAPYVRGKSNNAFWQYVLSLVVRFALAFVYFAVLFGGIALFLASVDFLFEVTIDFEVYADVWVVIVGILAVGFFLAGVPKDFEKLGKSSEYPKPLRVLEEFVVVPLVFLYMIVLYVYTGKIIVTWDWPHGDVASWIIVFSLAGVLAYFGAHSIKYKFQPYVDFMKKWLFAFLIPMAIILFMAVGIRINDYGITEPRYLIVVYGLWLLLMSFYFIFSKNRYLKVLPISLAVFTFVAAFGGPLSAFEVSKASQLDRLEVLFEANGMLVDGKAVTAEEGKLSEEDQQQIQNIVEYIVYNHGYEVLQSYFAEDLAILLDQYYKWDQVNEILRLIDLEYAYYYNDYSKSGVTYRYFESEVFCGYESCLVEVGGYDYFADFYLYSMGTESVSLYSGDQESAYDVIFDEEGVVVKAGEEVLVIFSFEFFADAEATDDNDFSMEDLTVEFETNEVSGKILIESGSLIFRDGKYDGVESIGGMILIDEK